MKKHKSVILSIFLSSLLIFILGACFSWAQEESVKKTLFTLNSFSTSLSSLKNSDSDDEKIYLTLQKAIEIALNENKGILVAKEKVDEAEQIIKIARSSYFPSLDLSGTYTRLREAPSMSIPFLGTFEMGKKDNYSAILSFTQPIYTSGRINLGYKQAKFGHQKEKENLNYKENELIFEVKKAFYSVLLAQENVKLFKDALKQAQRHLSIVEGFYQTGRISKFDLLRAKVEVANLKPNLIRAENNLRLAKEGLAILLSLPAHSIRLSGEFKFEPIRINLEEALKKALSSRNDLKSLNLQRDIIEVYSRLAKLAHAPSLYLRGNYQYNKPSGGEDEWGEDWNINLVLSLSLFDGGKSQTIIKQRKSQLKEVELSLGQLKDRIMLEVKSAFWGMEVAEESISAQKENIGQAEEALSIAELRYKSGMITNLEVLDAQLALTQAKMGYLKSLYDYNIAKAKLKKAMNNSI